MSFRKILCPVDFSDASRLALRMAATHAARDGAKLTILHVWPLPVYAVPEGVLDPRWINAQLGQIEADLASFREEATALGARDVDTRRVDGAPWHEIVRHAEKGGYDLIVVGAHGKSGIRETLLGSVAERVLRHAHCPVLVARPLPATT